ncbi:MAG: indole-3-glycerol phosphate synthase, partial [Thermoleophilales bacterium]|nr:indole-3-glycerol phosphate synthase [Thermoleophilales bacterium]
AVLLVVGAVSKRDLASLHDMARDLLLDTIVEVHDEDELERALEIDAEVIGINNRNLENFSVSLDTTLELLPDVPAGKTVVSESGITTRAEIEELERVGVDAVLVGETLMRALDPEAAVRELAGSEEPTQA